MANVTVGSVVANELIVTAPHSSGATTFGPAAVPAGFTVIMLSYDMRSVNSLTASFNGAMELSTNNGTSWRGLGSVGLNLATSGYQLSSGVLVRSATDANGPGAPVRVFTSRTILPKAHLTTRQVRGTLSATEAQTAGVTLAVW